MITIIGLYLYIVTITGVYLFCGVGSHGLLTDGLWLGKFLTRDLLQSAQNILISDLYKRVLITLNTNINSISNTNLMKVHVIKSAQ